MCFLLTTSDFRVPPSRIWRYSVFKTIRYKVYVRKSTPAEYLVLSKNSNESHLNQFYIWTEMLLSNFSALLAQCRFLIYMAITPRKDTKMAHFLRTISLIIETIKYIKVGWLIGLGRYSFKGATQCRASSSSPKGFLLFCKFKLFAQTLRANY